MDIYKESLFVQSGSIGNNADCVTFEFNNGSILFLLCENEKFLYHTTVALDVFQIEQYSLAAIVDHLLSTFGESEGIFALLFIFINNNETIESISQNMPPFILKNKKDEITLIDKNCILADVDNMGSHISKIPLDDVGMVIFVNNKRVMQELKERHFSVFAKCELENIIKSLSRRADDLNLTYFIMNNTLQDKIKFSFKERLPAKLNSIINYEAELEKILSDSYPKEIETNDNAMTVFNELVLNAYEHGTLGVDSNTKQKRILSGNYEEYTQDLEEQKCGFIDVGLTIYEQNLLKITIKDYGYGFKFSQYDCRQKDISEMMFHGRGVQMASQIGSIVYYEDNGSKVTFFIKYGQKTSGHIQHHDEEEMLKSMRVLYVEDDHFIRAQFSKILQRLVKNLYSANNGKEGLELYMMEHPDIVLTDIEMPKMNGLDMSEKIKEINPDQPIMIMTAYNQDENFLRAIDLGIDKYVIKPVKISQLKTSLFTTAKQLFYKKETMRLLKEKEQKDTMMLSDLQTQNRYDIAQQTAAFEKQQLVIHDDSHKFKDNQSCKVFYKPLERLSGDIYGVYKIDDANTILYIIDSMGKGLAASVTAVLSAAYINRAIDILIKKENFDFEKLVKDYQDYIKKYLLDDECVSFSMIHINHEKNIFRHGSFGMYPILIKDCDTLEIAEYKSNNAPFMKYFTSLGISEELMLPEKFGMFVFSDGLVETEFFGMQELLFHLKEGQEDEEIDLFKKVMDKNFISDDDLTLIHFSLT